jgi:hypothetical protein
MLFRIDRLVRFSNRDLESARKVLDQYHRLRKASSIADVREATSGRKTGMNLRTGGN